MEKDMRARLLTPQEIENLTKEQILEAMSNDAGTRSVLVIHCGEICVLEDGFVRDIEDPNHELVAWEKVDPKEQRELNAACSAALRAWEIENERLHAMRDRLEAERVNIDVLLNANDTRRQEALAAVDKLWHV